MIHLDDMRTTISLSDDLLREAKQRAIEAHTTVGNVIDNALRVMFSKPKSRTESSGAFRLKTFSGHGLRPGVDLDHSAALQDVMEEQ